MSEKMSVSILICLLGALAGTWLRPRETRITHAVDEIGVAFFFFGVSNLP